MFFQHVYDKTLAHSSYLIGCQQSGTAMVIDAKRDVDTYLQIANANQLKITHITETHIHADFLSGSRELAAATGAKMYLSDEGGADWQYEFEHVGLKDGDLIRVGNLSFEVLHTPGHTPESISFLLTDHPSSDVPVMLFTGDFVFVGDVGRPDLLEEAAGIVGTKEPGAREMYRSLQRFLALPDHLQLWSAHGAGSACGKALGAVPSSTVGYEKIRNWALRFGKDEEGFVQQLLDGQPEPPKYFAMMKKLNKIERPLLIEVPKARKLTATEFSAFVNKGTTIIDARPKQKFASGFLPGSINIQGNNSFANWCGWFLQYDEDFVLIADDDQIDDLTRKLMRIGLDNLSGYVNDPMLAGVPLQTVESIAAEELDAVADNPGYQLIDVRAATEFNAGTIGDAKHVFLGTIEDNLHKINPDSTVVVFCQAGDRSSIGYSILKKNGFNKVLNYPGGMKEWKEYSERTTKSINA